MNPPPTPTDATADEPPDAVALDQAEVDLIGSEAAGPAALRGSVLLGGGYAATIALSLISAPILIRHLGIANFGRYATVLALVTILSGLTDAGLFNIALREWSSRPVPERRRLMRGLLGVRLELSFAGLVAGVLFALVAGYDRAMVVGTIVYGAATALTAVTNILTVPLQGELRFGWITTINVARQAVAVALLVPLALSGAGLLPLLASAFPAGLIALLLAAMLVRRDMPLVPRLRGGEQWPLVRDTLSYAAAIAVNTLYFRITIIVMSLVAASQQTGYFATSFRVTEVLIGVPSLAIGAAFPILSRSVHNDRARFAFAAERIVELASIAGTALAVAVALSAPFVISVLAGPAGRPAVPVLQIQSIALLATFLTTAGGFVLLSLRRHRALLVTNCVALLTNLLLTLVLVHADQAQGGAIAGVIAESGLAITLLVLMIRAGVVRIRASRLAATSIAGLAAALPLIVPGLDPLLRLLLGLTVYVAVLGLFGLIPPEVRHALRRRQRKLAT
ncbi:MAG: lipopolysaccharide biosynthesis protein [Solirubrobacteraceae bacterium]